MTARGVGSTFMYRAVRNRKVDLDGQLPAQAADFLYRATGASNN